MHGKIDRIPLDENRNYLKRPAAILRVAMACVMRMIVSPVAVFEKTFLIVGAAL